jgi:predicted nuclease of predicted toxin-antitoxin system
VRILFDQGVPVPLRDFLRDHSVKTAYEMGWARLENGLLIDSAEGAFDALITTDQNLRYQQNLTGRRLAVLVLPTTSWPQLQVHIVDVVAAVGGLHPGEFFELTFQP